MRGPFCVIVVSVFYVTTNGQCPIDIKNDSLTSCEGMTKHGPIVFVDFNKINRPCACIVTPLFVGELLVSSRKAIGYVCNTEIQVQLQEKIVFGCPIPDFSSGSLNVTTNQLVDVRAKYKPISTRSTETFYHCMGFQQNGEQNGNLSITCGTPSEITTTVSSTTIITTSSVKSTSVAITNKSTYVTVSSNTVISSSDSFSMNSTKDDPEMLYIITGSAAGGAILLVGLVVLILILIKRSSIGDTKNRSAKLEMAHTNTISDNNAELPNNPLYLSSQPMNEMGYSSDQEKQLGLPPTDSKKKKKINSDYDVPPNNKPINQNASSMPVYAVPKRSKDRTPEISSGDVYAEVCKPNRSTAKDPVRKHNEDGLLYMEVEQDTAATKQTNTKVKHEITEGVCYAEIKHT